MYGYRLQIFGTLKMMWVTLYLSDITQFWKSQ